MNIAGNKIEPGESKQLSFVIARLPSHTDIELVIHVHRSKKPGPVVLFSGGLHGDEINGIEIVRRILDQGIGEPVTGTVISIPILNVYGFINFSRYVPDGKDINRSFPGSTTGSLAARVAHFIDHNILPLIDFGLDFHTGGDNRTNFPQIRCDYKDKMSIELAKSTNAPFLVNSPLIPRSLRSAAFKRGKRILVYEGGESMRMDELAISEGIECAKNLLEHLGMSSTTENEVKDSSSIVISDSKWIRSKYSGIFHSEVSSGQIMEKGEIIGFITDPFGAFRKKIKMPVEGYIIGLNNTPIVHQGDALVHYGTEKLH